MSLVVNVLVYQVIWFLCVFMGSAGAMVSLALLAGHLAWSPGRRADLQIMLVLLSAGLLIDGVLKYSGIVSYAVDGIPIPFWLAVIWLALAMLPNHSLRWLKGRPLLSSMFAAIGGPLAYWAGVSAGAAKFESGLAEALLLLAVIWGSLWPLVMSLANGSAPKTDRYSRPHDSSCVSRLPITPYAGNSY